MLRIIEFAHKVIKDKISKNDICVDMTIGNGNDTLFLTKNCRFVYGFDIQNQAIENTTKLLKENNISNYQLFLSSHENVNTLIKEKVKAFIFNLGYLPSGDKTITTHYESTIKAINNSLEILDEKGVIVIVVYPGHESGKIEDVKLNEYVSLLPQKLYDVVSYRFINQINNPPYVIVIERK